MTDFFDWLTAADSGAAAERLAAQFKISPKEMRETTDALVPAFMLGIQRTMADPAAWTQLMRIFGAAAGGIPGASLPSKEAGDAVMRALFGAELMQAVARQASLLTGQAPDTIAKMMPSLGALTVQSMMQMMASASARNPQAYPTDATGQALAEAMRRSANAMEAYSRPSTAAAKGPSIPVMTDIFADALKGGFPWMSAPGADAGMAADPFAFFSKMMATFSNPPSPANVSSGRAKDQDRPPQTADRQPSASPPSFPGVMANAHSLQADYMREMMSLFERHRRP